MIYKDFIYEIFRKISLLKRLDVDFQLRITFIIHEDVEIDNLYEYILKMKNNNSNFDIFINDKFYYQRIFNTENIDIQNKNIFREKMIEEKREHNSLKIMLQLYNIKANELFYYYKQLGIEEVTFLYNKFKIEKLKAFLSNKKYEHIDKRNFNVIRTKQSPMNNLLKYTGYYNQLGDIILNDHINFYIAKINIAIGGFIGSGKSTLINAIFGEKRCLEGQGGSTTNYISQFNLGNYPINFIDFPGFRAKSHGKNHTTLFIEEIKSKISDLKKMNEVIHCFLFCINYWQKAFDEKDDDVKEVFDAIAQLKIRTFFIITVSEKKEAKGFQNLRTIIVNNLEQIKKNYPDGVFNKIFGNDLNKNIIPILSKDKEFHGTIAEAFGLDQLFEELYKYFKPKKIDYGKQLFLDEERLNLFIKNNELLTIFESKRKLSDDLKIKIKIEIDKILMKLFLKAPKYIYNFSKENFYEIIKEIFEHVFNVFIHYIDQKDSLEKYKFLKMLGNFDDKKMIKLIINDNTLKYYSKELDEQVFAKDFENGVPWFLKIFFISILLFIRNTTH